MVRRTGVKADAGTNKKIRVSGGAARQAKCKWVESIKSAADELIQSKTHPAQWCGDVHGPGYDTARTHLQIGYQVATGVPAVTFAGEEFRLPHDETSVEMNLPLEAFTLDPPRVGDVVDLPRLDQWMNWLSDITVENYKGDLEPVRIKAHEKSKGNRVHPGGITAVKGFSRISILYFATHHALKYMQENECMAEDDSNMLIQCPPTCLPKLNLLY